MIQALRLERRLGHIIKIDLLLMWKPCRTELISMFNPKVLRKYLQVFPSHATVLLNS